MSTIIAAVQVVPAQAWTTDTQTGGATAKTTLTYQWHPNATTPATSAYHGGFESYGTLYDTVTGDIDNAKWRIKVVGYAWSAQLTVKNGSASIPSMLRWDGAATLTPYVTLETCEGKPLIDSCAQKVLYNPNK